MEYLKKIECHFQNKILKNIDIVVFSLYKGKANKQQTAISYKYFT